MSDSSKNLYKKLLGSKGERLTIKYLKKQGYQILETNYRVPCGEADIIAKKGNNIVFVADKQDLSCNCIETKLIRFVSFVLYFRYKETI